MRDLNFLRTCALLHDIGKPECWANRKPWSRHVHYTFEFVKETLGEDYAYASMRHHTGPSYEDEYRPKTEVERIICLADNLASGADRAEEPVRGPPLPKPPVELTHILSNRRVRVEADEAKLAYTAQTIKAKFKEVGKEVGERLGEVYQRIYDYLEGSDLRLIPADTRRPINDVSLWDHLKLTAASCTCIFSDGGYRGDDLERYGFALLSGDADGVSKFVSTSTRVPDLRARSEMIKEATKAAGRSIREALGPECLIYAGGGGFLALSPVKGVEDIASKARDAFEKASGGEVTMRVSHVEEGGRKVQREFGEIWRAAIRKMQLKKLERPPSLLPFLEEDTRVCDVCHVRPAVHGDASKILPIDASPRPEALCGVCWRLREEGRKYEPKVELDDIKRDTNFVAVLKADGDDMGEALRGERFEKLDKSTTPSRLSALSSLIHGTCEVRLSKTVEKYGGLCLFAGGDDVLAILPGERALEAAKHLASEFRDAMAGVCTMSAGVAIFHYRLPIYVGLEVAQELLSAKAKAVEDKDSIAFAIIGGSGVTRNALDQVRAYKWRELDELLGLVDYLDRRRLPMSQIRRIAEATRGDRKEAEILIKYLMGRQVIPWGEGERLISYLDSGLLYDAFLIYNAFRPRGG